MVALLLVAVSLGLSNFAASVGIGVSGVDARARLRVGIIFGIFETAMPILGLLAGRGLDGIQLAGDPAVLTTLMSLLDTPDPAFPIVTP